MKASYHSQLMLSFQHSFGMLLNHTHKVYPTITQDNRIGNVYLDDGSSHLSQMGYYYHITIISDIGNPCNTYLLTASFISRSFEACRGSAYLLRCNVSTNFQSTNCSDIPQSVWVMIISENLRDRIKILSREYLIQGWCRANASQHWPSTSPIPNVCWV